MGPGPDDVLWCSEGAESRSLLSMVCRCQQSRRSRETPSSGLLVGSRKARMYQHRADVPDGHMYISAGPPFSELSHQSCPFQEGYLRIFSVTFLQITCTCFPARFLVTIIFQQLSCQLITGRNTKLPTTLRGLQQLVGKMFCGQEKATPTGWCCNNNATTTQTGKTTSVP